jgi:precorrin-6B methylase 2
VIEFVPIRLEMLDDGEKGILERIGTVMSIKDVKSILIVVSLIIAGCAPEKPTSEKATSQGSKSADQVNNTVGTAANQQTPPSAGKETVGTSAPQTVAADKNAEPAEEPKRPDVIFVPTPPEVVAKMLELAQVTKDDVVYDLGCGNGRIVVMAAKKYGCKAFGFDVDPQRIKESNESVDANGVGDLVTIQQKDIFTLDLSPANVVTLYLLPSLNVKLIPQLEKLKPGSRIVSHDFDMRGVKPDQVVEVTSDNGSEHTVYLWTTPLKKEAERSNE